MVDARTVIGGLVGSNITLFLLARALSRELRWQRLQYKKLYGATEYLMHIIEEEGIDLSEFDLIALEILSGDNNAS